MKDFDTKDIQEFFKKISESAAEVGKALKEVADQGFEGKCEDCDCKTKEDCVNDEKFSGYKFGNAIYTCGGIDLGLSATKLSEEDINKIADKVVEKMVGAYANTLITPQEKIVLDKGNLVAFNGEEEVFILNEDGTLKINGGTLSSIPKIPSARSSKEKVLEQAKEKYNKDIKEIKFKIECAVEDGKLSEKVFSTYNEDHVNALEAIFKQKGYKTNVCHTPEPEPYQLLVKYTLALKWG